MPLFNVLFRRDSTANWEAANPILLDGEVGYERTADGLLLMKMGDGVMDASGVVSGTHWKDLPYCSGPVGPSPEHEWSGTELKFKNPDGSWGTSVDLKGAKGDTGKTGPQGVPGKDGQDGKDGAPGTAQPATASTLGGSAAALRRDQGAEHRGQRHGRERRHRRSLRPDSGRQARALRHVQGAGVYRGRPRAGGLRRHADHHPAGGANDAHRDQHFRQRGHGHQAADGEDVYHTGKDDSSRFP